MSASTLQAEEQRLQAVRAYCQAQGWSTLQVGNPPQLLVQWPLNGNALLLRVTPYEAWSLLFLVPLGNVPEAARQASLLASGTLNYHLPLACVEVEPLRGEARARVTLTPEGEPSKLLLERAFRALEEAIVGFAAGVQAFQQLQNLIEACPDRGATEAPEAMAAVWRRQLATD